MTQPSNDSDPRLATPPNDADIRGFWSSPTDRNHDSVKNTPLLKSLDQFSTDAAQGNLQDLGNNLSSFLATGVMTATDPFNMLVGTGFDFLMNFIAPVRDILHIVSGDGDALRQKAKDFDGARGELERLAKSLSDAIESELPHYQGPAADALRAKVTAFAKGVHDTAGQAHNLAELLRMSAIMMDAVEGFIRGFIRDFLTFAILNWATALATAGPTFGGSTAAATAMTAVEAGMTFARVAQTMQRFMNILQNVVHVMIAIKAALDTVRIVNAVDQITQGHKDGSSDLSTTGSIVGNTRIASASGKNMYDGYKRPFLNEAEKRGKTVDGKGNITDIDSKGKIGKLDSPGESITDTDDTTVTYQKSKAYTRDRVGRSAEVSASVQLGNAADALEKQAKEGGYAQVPDEKTISGELDV